MKSEGDLFSEFLEHETIFLNSNSKFLSNHVWHLSRRRVFNYIRKQHSKKINYANLSVSFAKPSSALFSIKSPLRLELLLSGILSLINDFVIFAKPKSAKVLILSTSRAINIPSTRSDPYTFAFVDDLERRCIPFIQLVQVKDFSLAILLKYFAHNDASFIFDFVLYFLLSFVYHLKNRNLYCSNLLKSFISKFSDVELSQSFISSILFSSEIRYMQQYLKYLVWLSITKPLSLYIVCAYGNEGIVAAAKKLQIPVTEFQHGIISKYHLGYNVLSSAPPNFFPNKILVFGQYWIDNNFFYPSISCECHDYRWLQIHSYPSTRILNVDIEDKNNTWLFVSQPSLPAFNRAISNLALNNIDSNFLYRPHPRELTRADFSKAELCNNFSTYPNLTISQNAVFADDLRLVSGIICCRSFTAYEALSMGLKVILASPFEDCPIPEISDYVVSLSLRKLNELRISDIHFKTYQVPPFFDSIP